MSAIGSAAQNVPAAKLISLRLPLIICSVLAAGGIVAGALLDHLVMGILFAVGMGMGLYNARLMQKQVLRVISEENPTKRAIVGSSTQRLIVLTVIALALGFFMKPDGLGVFVGLAVFQLVFMGNTMLPVMKEYRRQ